MNVVRDMNKVQSTTNQKPGNRGQQDNQVFKRHQQNRLKRFDNLIMTYVQFKQNDIFSEEIKENMKDAAPDVDFYKYNHLEINSVL